MAYAGESVADVDAVGATIDAATHTTRAAAAAACDRDPACVGVSHAAGSGFWRTFAGLRWEGAVGRVRAVGETVNSWVPGPTGA